MPYYITRGQVPEKRHTQFRSPSGKLYSEELVSTEGFSSDYSLLYHIHPPTQILSTDPPAPENIKIAEEKMLKHRSLEGFSLEPDLLFNCLEPIESWQVEDLNGDGISDLIVKLAKEDAFRVFISRR